MFGLIAGLMLAISSPAQPEIQGLPDEAPRSGVVITVDVSTNTAYLFRDGVMEARSPAATGTEKTLIRGIDEWIFHTPEGHMKVLRRIVDPVWRKPDWAYIEAGEPVPPPNAPERYVKHHLGRFALDLGDGIMIHGTDDAGSIGHYASHGCIRLPNGMLERLWNETTVGTDVYVFESRPGSAEQMREGQQR